MCDCGCDNLSIDENIPLDYVRDEPRVLRENLEFEGFRVIGAASGKESLAKARQERPHAVLLDLMLPGLDGLEVCRRLKSEELTRELPVIVLTARKDPALVTECFKDGAYRYLSKPFTGEQLRGVVEACRLRETCVGVIWQQHRASSASDEILNTSVSS